MREVRHTCVEVHGDVGQVELLQSIVDTLQVGALRIGAFGDVEVGHQVGQAVGFCKMSEKGGAQRRCTAYR